MADTLVERDAELLAIAKKHLFVETLETRNSDSLDFHDVSAASIKAALEAAYEAGRSAGYDEGREVGYDHGYDVGRALGTEG